MNKCIIYMDYNATTPVDYRVRDAMLPYFCEVFGNPSSVHTIGRQARVCLDEARSRAAEILGCNPLEITFTSGGTESNNLAIIGTARKMRERGKHIITPAIEHHAVLCCCEYLAKHEGFELTILPVDSSGFVDPDAVKKAIRHDTILVSIMAANNEIGTIQPIKEIGNICRQYGVIFHTDAVQFFGKEGFEKITDLNADLVSICAHKIHGPKGAGLLYTRSPLKPMPIIFGGSHENKLRAGTENLPAIMGFVKAMELFLKPPVFDRNQIQPLADRVINLINNLDGVRFRGSLVNRLCNTVAFTVNGVESEVIIAGLDIEGICVSGGAACSTGALLASHVITALGSPSDARSLVRISLGRENTMEDIAHLEKVLPSVIRRARIHAKKFV
jgi:cysteine desulfurase